MDVNNTHYHLLLGERDWLPLLAANTGDDLWWEGQSQTIGLAPLLKSLPSPDQQQSLASDQRRGAAFDHYGNIFWIDENRSQINIRPATTPNVYAEHWHASALRHRPPLPQQHGDFHTREDLAIETDPLLSGLTVTSKGFLIVGTLQPAGLLVFDLHGGGPPQWLRWPVAVNFGPVDFSATPAGGLWILDSETSVGTERLWHLDEYFQVTSCSGELTELETPFDHDFHELGVEATGSAPIRFRSGIALNSFSPAILLGASAIEVLSDERLLVLVNGNLGELSYLHYFVAGEWVQSSALDSSVIGDAVAVAEIIAHDMAFVKAGTSVTSDILGSLFIGGSSGSQGFELAVIAAEDELELSLLPRLLPMREFAGKAIISSGTKPYYDFGSTWLPLAEQPSINYQLEGLLEGIVFDSKLPGCVWHRIVMDATIPSGTSLVIESRTGNTLDELAQRAWQEEPLPYLRGNGSELPFHEPWKEKTKVCARTGSWDLLLQNAVGQYIELRILFKGTGKLTPVIKACRTYFPRFSYLSRYLPDVYSEDVTSAHFMDRFLANVEGIFTELEDRIANIQQLFDTRTTPAEFLPWLAGWLGGNLDSILDEQRKRLFIDNAELLFRWRGTLLGIKAIVKLTVDECPGDYIFDPLREQGSANEDYLGGRDVRLVESFLTRRYPGLLFSDPEATSSLQLVDKQSSTTQGWSWEQGTAPIQQRYLNFVLLRYGNINTVELINLAWDTRYTTMADVLFPAVMPENEVHASVWVEFTRDCLEFTYAAVTNEHLALYQDFLSRRYRQIDRLNQQYQLSSENQLANFQMLNMPDVLPEVPKSLVDWMEFVSLAIPIHQQAHRFSVLLPTAPGELPEVMENRRAQVEKIVEREKPAHTSFEVKFYWAMFQVGSARLGIDSVIGEGNRFVAMVLGRNFLGQSYLAESHPWNIFDRTVVGREQLSGDSIWRASNE